MREAGVAAPIEPVFVPIHPPPSPRVARAPRSDAALRAIEASYAPISDLHEWLEHLCGELDGLGLGTWGSVPVSDGMQVVGARMIVPGAGVFLRVNEGAAESREILRDLHIAACVPADRIVNVQSHWQRLMPKASLAPQEISERFGMTLPPATALLCTSADGQEGVVAMLDTDRPIAKPMKRQLLAVAAHVEHAYRLRRGLRQWASEEARAVLSPEGKLLHAEREAIAETESLTRAVRASEKARGSMRRLSPEEALASWKALVEGQWSIAEHVEQDGKRLLLAFENAPVTPALVLSAQEKRVVSYAALGHSQKYIAYELGLTPSSVSRYLASALQKLRLKNREELISVLGPRAPSSPKAPSDGSGGQLS
jgi:DNA-binding CsgD family transcriptional regulator